MSEPEWVQLKWFPNEILAQTIAASLGAAGIDCVIQRDDTAGLSAFTRTDGGARLLVPREALRAARELLGGLSDTVEPSTDETRFGRQSAPPMAIATGLNDIRKRRRTMWGLFLGFPLLGVLVLSLFGEWGIIAAPALGIAYLMAGWRAASARCPRCGDHFSRKRGVAYGWNQRCLHCGLPLRP